ncbi:helix-turn-helix domain-containing protein [Marivita hallyeonensis]|uniref:Helix-turn-helix domain-containing protein n=1 Tax=Marivita hallyeonensis TaxID=996342 RepID=A0A1M5XGU7_9RHOB|nr:helix-turn-helix domain-containing protein [Marivita hallyeonensis]SHH99057.1 Helix-turn-helix domain-containing protein [Marivita hallyeonensis]
MAVSGLGHRLAAVRNMARLSQEEMSQALGISRSAYQNYERGQRDLTAQLLLEVYEKFDVDPLWMLEGDSEDGKNRRHEEIATAYRKIGIAVERRIMDRGLSVTPEKKWDAIDFLFDEVLNTDALSGESGPPDTTRIDSVLRLVS